MTNCPLLPVNKPGSGPFFLMGLGLAHPAIASEIMTSSAGKTRRNIVLFTFNLADQLP
jgi:hypothetical protein|tara:strand:- start:343 stop:516 length:174 start_codon:yes stop_codon:yes gene_type:complete